MIVVDDGTTSEEDRLGAIGDIGHVIEREEIDDDLVVVAGDNLFSETLGDFGRLARERNEPLLAVHDIGDLELIRGRYNSIEVDESRARDVLRGEAAGAALDALRHRALLLPTPHVAADRASTSRAGENPDQPGRLVQWLYPRVDVFTWQVPGRWYDIGSREQLEEADRIFSAQS